MDSIPRLNDTAIVKILFRSTPYKMFTAIIKTTLVFFGRFAPSADRQGFESLQKGLLPITTGNRIERPENRDILLDGRSANLVK
jgi:hypothetical protein